MAAIVTSNTLKSKPRLPEKMGRRDKVLPAEISNSVDQTMYQIALERTPSNSLVLDWILETWVLFSACSFFESTRLNY
jgi:hypothetical protein